MVNKLLKWVFWLTPYHDVTSQELG